MQKLPSSLQNPWESERSDASTNDSQQPRSTEIKVACASLRNGISNRLKRRPWYWRLMKHNKYVQVEARPDGRFDSVFYAPFSGADRGKGNKCNSSATVGTVVEYAPSEQGKANRNNKSRSSSSSSNSSSSRSAANRYDPMETQLIPVDPSIDCANLCLSTDNIEISFVGMCIPPSDAFDGSDNEGLLYSLQKFDPSASKNKDDDDDGFDIRRNEDIVAGTSRRQAGASNNAGRPTVIKMQRHDFPIVHYDPILDGFNRGTVPNAFTHIPESQSLYLQHSGDGRTRQVPMRFSVMEVDKLTDDQIRVVRELEQLDGMASQVGNVVPYATVVTKAINELSLFGRKFLQHYLSPDLIISIDFHFKLFHNEKEQEQEGEGEEDTQRRRQQREQPRRPQNHPDAYLRYGYYFFLAHDIDAKLYAQTDASMFNVQLLVKHAGGSRTTPRGQQLPKYFPLSNVAYVVIKVERGIQHDTMKKTVSRARENRDRLQQILTSIKV